MLLGTAGRDFPRNQLMDSIWHDVPEGNDRTVDTHIKILRIKLKAVAPAADLIRTHRGLGYSVELVVGDKSTTS